MAANTVPWWRKAIQFAIKGIRAVLGIQAADRPAPEPPIAIESGIAASRYNEPEIDRPKDRPEKDRQLTESFPQVTAEASPEVAAESAPPEANREPEAVQAAETPAPIIPPAENEAAIAAEAAPEPEPPAPATSEPAPEAEEAPAPEAEPESVAQEAVVEVVAEIEEGPAPQEEQPAPVEADEEAVEVAAEETVEEPAEEPAEEPSESQALDPEPPATAGAIEESALVPEVETHELAPEPEFASKPALDQSIEACEEQPAIAEPDSPEPGASTDGIEDAAEPESLPEEPQALQEAIEPVEADPEPAPEFIEAQADAAIPAPEPPAPEPEPAPEPATPAAPVHQAIKREEGPDNLPVSIFVNHVYEGPLDLLLDLIRKQDIDIYDIPIAKITAQFLAYVNHLKVGEMDVAGEFIYTASLLIHIKSKLLLPREPSGADDAAEDPRRELVERLLEHERFKNAAQMLQQKQMLEAASWTNPGMREFRDDEATEPEIAADTVDLVRIFQEILERARNRPIINVEEDSVTVGQMIQFLSRRLTMEDRPVALRRLLSHTHSERALIAMFLALLELVRLQAILLRQDLHFSEIFIKKNTGFESVISQNLARDDWQ